MKQESKTLREFSLRLNSKRGDNFIIKYGYDASAKHSGVRISASINGSDFSSTKKVLNRVRALNITALNNLIDAIGTDVTGAPYDYETQSETIIDSTDWNDITSFYRIDTDREEGALEDFFEKYAGATSQRQERTVLRRYNNSRRVTFLEKSKTLLKGLRTLYMKGVEINGKTYIPKFEGILRKSHVPFHYKRDIDYIRKARYKVFTTILKRNYIPFK